MAMADTRDRLAAELTGPIGLLGLDLEAVDLTSAGKRRILRVAIDKDGGVTMDDIADATREVSLVLDDTDLMGRQAYTLEVSSPGPERPLTKPDHFRRFIGRRARVRLREPREGHRSFTGELVGASDDEVTVAAEEGVVSIPYAEINRSNLLEGKG